MIKSDLFEVATENEAIEIERDKYGFRYIRTSKNLKHAIANNEVYVSVECKCCGRQIVIPINKFGLSCQERKEMKIDSVIK